MAARHQPLARAHREQALELVERALRSDIADIQVGTTAEVVRLGAMAGSVDLLQRCFAGLDTLWFSPPLAASFRSSGVRRRVPGPIAVLPTGKAVTAVGLGILLPLSFFSEVFPLATRRSGCGPSGRSCRCGTSPAASPRRWTPAGRA